jgi:hypothetical protein
VKSDDGLDCVAPRLQLVLKTVRNPNAKRTLNAGQLANVGARVAVASVWLENRIEYITIRMGYEL